MKRLIIFSFLAFFSITPFGFSQQDIPSSPRSREAIVRVKGKLKKELAGKALHYGAPIFIRIFKKEKVLEVWVKNRDDFGLFKTYPVCTYGSGALGPKTAQHDGQAPEGFYYVVPNRLNPASAFHLSFNIGYPNRYDRYHQRTGGDIMVHGSCVSIGCFAMTDKGIEEIYALADAALRNGQAFFRVHIFPFKMTNENMEKHASPEWQAFWRNLKDGHDFFNNGNIPPNVEVEYGRYVFQKQ